MTPSPHVSNEMVERAAVVFYRLTGSPYKTAYEKLSDEEKEYQRIKAKIMLTAALSAMPGTQVPRGPSSLHELDANTGADPLGVVMYFNTHAEKDAFMKWLATLPLPTPAGTPMQKVLDEQLARDRLTTPPTTAQEG